MTEHDGVAHLGDIETALRREVDIVAERFPAAPAAEVEQVVRTNYENLLRTAAVEAHVLSLTRSQAVDELIARGYELHPPEPSEG